MSDVVPLDPEVEVKVEEADKHKHTKKEDGEEKVAELKNEGVYKKNMVYMGCTGEIRKTSLCPSTRV